MNSQDYQRREGADAARQRSRQLIRVKEPVRSQLQLPVRGKGRVNAQLCQSREGPNDIRDCPRQLIVTQVPARNPHQLHAASRGRYELTKWSVT